MAQVNSVHSKGGVKVELTAQAGVPGGGAVVWALFRGDVSGHNYSPRAHIRGQVVSVSPEPIQECAREVI